MQRLNFAIFKQKQKQIKKKENKKSHRIHNIVVFILPCCSHTQDTCKSFMYTSTSDVVIPLFKNILSYIYLLSFPSHSLYNTKPTHYSSYSTTKYMYWTINMSSSDKVLLKTCTKCKPLSVHWSIKNVIFITTICNMFICFYPLYRMF